MVTSCYHCGEPCVGTKIGIEEKSFCCFGCKMVYQLLNQNGLCQYYDLNLQPGTNQRTQPREGKFAFLDDDKIAAKLIGFSDGRQTQADFYLPQIHCSSCLWLLENLQQMNAGIQSSRVDFNTKEITVLFANKKISLRQVAETLAGIGYEPHIGLHQLKDGKKKVFDKARIYRLGIAGFCFGNIMLLSFPEYFSSNVFELTNLFRYLNLLLALPVFFYSAGEFYKTAWKGLQHRFLNIDAPIVLAIFITFGRSLYEIIGGSGAGYLDSMTGIVFFMLIGRVLQDKTHRSLSFDRDYTSYFPVAVNKIVDGKEQPTSLPELKTGDSIIIHSNEIIPADGILVRGHAAIDYSFVTGEMIPVEKQISEIIYAGGRQVGGNIELLLVKDVSQSYLTSLWNKASMKKETEDDQSFVHRLSKYFTIILFAIAAGAGLYWWLNDPSRIWPAITAVLIIACPCALLLSNSFTNGHILHWFDKGKCYLQNAMVLEKMAGIDHIVFDKTGTLTTNGQYDIKYTGDRLTPWQEQLIASVAEQSYHPLSKAVAAFLNMETTEVTSFVETAGQGIEAWVDDHHVVLGSPAFVFGKNNLGASGSAVAFRIGNEVKGCFILRNHFRKNLGQLIKRLQKKVQVSVISGDNDAAKEALEKLTGTDATLLFFQSPEDKLHHIEKLQKQGHNVMMIGDGLNDAGALKQSDVGIALTENTNNFSPACDAIMEAGSLQKLDRFISLAKNSKRIVVASFIISILYNIIGLSFAVQGTLQPVVAAILMPVSSISIIVFTWLAAQVAGKKLLK
ncbi:MAG: heavy metal translocating P-type ATPase metal-binding domain-containing protein [Bacteroidota bacterium]